VKIFVRRREKCCVASSNLCFCNQFKLALKLGVRPERIETIADFAAATKYGVKTVGNAQAARATVLAELAQLIDWGELEIPIACVYRLAAVREAYRKLEQRHTLGKIVLVP
jgi:NADPH:quinone reductase-like Zn-dependent oxidoreductase